MTNWHQNNESWVDEALLYGNYRRGTESVELQREMVNMMREATGRPPLPTPPPRTLDPLLWLIAVLTGFMGFIFGFLPGGFVAFLAGLALTGGNEESLLVAVLTYGGGFITSCIGAPLGFVVAKEFLVNA